MSVAVSGLWRHPIKSHGRETLQTVTLTEGQTMPWDRVWAVAHDASKASNEAWSPCASFSIGSKAPGLMAINAVVNEATGRVTLTHPDRPVLELDPDAEPERLIDWVQPIMPENRAASTRVVRVPGRGMTDTDFPSIGIGNMATHRTIEQKLGRRLSEKRWRLNLWIDGLTPWEEFDWIGHEVEIGSAQLKVVERIERCMATTANPDTGRRDTDTLAVLNTWGHQDMGVYGIVSRTGQVSVGDKVRLV